MNDIPLVKELLNTGLGTEGSLLIERTVHSVLIGEVEKNLLPRDLAAVYVGPSAIKGSSYDFNLEIPRTGSVRLTAEGAAYFLDQGDYTVVNVRPLKYGVILRITRELIEDSKFDIMSNQMATFGRRMAENENGLVITALDGASTTVSAGASITPLDLTTLQFNLEENDFEMTDLVVGNEVMRDIRNIDTYVEADKSGNTDILSTGFRGIVYGARVHRVSSNAGMTKTSAYAFDRRQAYAIAEKRTYTTEGFDIPSHDMSAAALSQRIAVVLLRSTAVSKLTSS